MGRNFRNKQNVRIRTTYNIRNKETIIKLLITILLVVLAFGFYFLINNEQNLNTLTYNANQTTDILELQNKVDAEIAEPFDFIASEENSETEISSDTSVIEKTTATIKLAAVGNIIPSSAIIDDSFDNSSSTYDFSHLFTNIQYYTRTADLTLGNLETCFAGESYNYSSYNTPNSFANTLKYIGFDVLSLASDHSLDFGSTGIGETINTINNADILHTGTSTSSDAQDTIVYKYIKGVKIGFINFCSNSTTPSGEEYLVNPVDNELMLKHITEAKNAGCELIIASLHWGTESSTSSTNEQIDISNFLFSNGVDIILGSHPTSILPMETRSVTLDDGTTKDCFIIYSLGNFVSTPAQMSIILNLTITKNEDSSFSIDTPSYTPVYLHQDTSVSTNSFGFIDVLSQIESYEAGYKTISDALYSTFKSQLAIIDSNLKTP